MKSLLKEFSRGDIQQDLKNSDGSDAGRNDTATKPADVRFSLMRNMINTNGDVTGSGVNDYLERAHDLNDEVDSVGFAIETDNGDLIKVYVNAQQADEFEAECSKLLGLDDDSEAAINTLAQRFDIIDVVWPQDPETGEGEVDVAASGEDDVNIDDDLSSFMDDDEDDVPSEGEAAVSAEDGDGDADSDDLGDTLPADDDVNAKPKKKSLMKDVAGGSSEESDDEESEEESEDTDAAGGGEKKKKKESKEPKASAEDEESSEESSEEGEGGPEGGAEGEPDEETEEPELDADGNPIKKKKKKKTEDGTEVTEEGLELTEGVTVKKVGVGYRIFKDGEEIGDAWKRPNSNQFGVRLKGLYWKNNLATKKGGLSTTSVKKLSDIPHFVSTALAHVKESVRDDVNDHVARETARLNDKSHKFVIDCLMTGGTLGRREYLYQEDGEVKYFDTMEEAEGAAKDLCTKRNHTMARAAYKFTARAVKEEDEMIGDKFLQRVTEAEEKVTIKDGVWRGIHSRMKRPYEKKIIEFFDALGIPGRYVRGKDGLEDSIRAGGDILRRAGRKQTLFNQFFDGLVGGGAGSVTEAKKGTRLQKVLETVMVSLGFPADLVSAEGMVGPLDTMIRRAAARIEADNNLEASLIAFAKALGLTTKQVNESGNQTFTRVGKYEAWEPKPIKVREPGWYVVDHMDKAVAGPFNETGARREAEEMNDEFKAKNSTTKGDIEPFDVLEFDEDDIKRLKRANEDSSVGVKFLNRVLGEEKGRKAKNRENGRGKNPEFYVMMGDKPIAGPFTKAQGQDAIVAAVVKALKSAPTTVSEEVDVGQDDFMETVMNLVLALGIPEGLLQPRRQQIIRALREKKLALTNRGMLMQRMNQLIGLIEKGTKVAPANGNVQESLAVARTALTEQALFEAFGPLEAIVGASLKHFNADEPAAGPAMMAGYEGSGSHEETVLVVAVDPDADDDNKSLRVGIDSPWDGGIHAKYFANNKDGYKAAIEYANMLRTCNLKKGGRPKGWKDSAPSVSRLPADDSSDFSEE